MDKLVEDFLNEEVRAYSIEVLKNRAIPNIIDGFKNAQRKIVFTANKTAKKEIKTVSLVGKSIDVGGYDKGDGSLPGIIDGLTQDFIGANNIPWLSGTGQFGSRQIPDGSAAARYTKIAIHKNFEHYFTDKEILKYEEQDEILYEPTHFLPRIPTVLLNYCSGIAVGFACEIQPYKKENIICNIKLLLDGKKQKRMTPYYEGYKGNIIRGEKWVMEGIIERPKKYRYKITEIPVQISRENYIKQLEKMIDKGIIHDYIEDSEDDGFEFEIIVSGSQDEKLQKLDNEDLLKSFGLLKNLNENLNLISENNTLLQFRTPYKIIKYFVDYRLKVLTRRKNYKISELSSILVMLEEKFKFVTDVRLGTISLKILKSKQQLKDILSKQKYTYIEDLITIPVYSFTKEFLYKISAQIKETKKELKYYQTVTEKELFLEDLKEL